MLESQNRRVHDHEARVEGSYGNEDVKKPRDMLETFIEQIS
ncbi:hypothetical protein [Mesorhizobium amorphae]|nr:hypothetical protein [Mesorhizobium amorphae]